MAMYLAILIGTLIYMAPIMGYFLLDPIRVMLDQALFLAFELTVMMTILYVYPFAIFVFHVVRRYRAESGQKFLVLQAQVASSVVVSLGLIGTFQGLTAMVTEISKSVGGDAPIDQRMVEMMGAIGGALSAMGYAFLTSILGVAASVVILLGVNFLKSFYKEEENETPKGNARTKMIKVSHDIPEVVSLLNRNNEILKQLVGALKEQNDKELIQGVERKLEHVISTQSTQYEYINASMKNIYDEVSREIEINVVKK